MTNDQHRWVRLPEKTEEIENYLKEITLHIEENSLWKKILESCLTKDFEHLFQNNNDENEES